MGMFQKQGFLERYPLTIVGAESAWLIANFEQVVKTGDLRLHPMVAGLLVQETLERMDAKGGSQSDDVEKA